MEEAPRNAAPLLEIQGLQVIFGRQTVLRDITMQVPRGQRLAIIGESGCGKTVLLKCIIGLVMPTKGIVSFDGHDLSQLSDREMTLQRIRYGFVFQNAALFDSMTIGQNVAFPLRQHRRLPEQELQEIVIARLAEVGLPDSIVYKKPAELSGGMRKRVGLARALVLNPELVLYDEPTTGLDPIMSDVINELMLRTASQHRVTSIIVTHDMNSARKVADRVVMLMPLSRLRSDESQVIYDGPPEELEHCRDRRVRQFVRGEAGDRLMELRQAAQDARSI
ncbi:MAG: ABC transporter ATP-binding protein [Pirellulaceae bacterium]